MFFEEDEDSDGSSENIMIELQTRFGSSLDLINSVNSLQEALYIINGVTSAKLEDSLSEENGFEELPANSRRDAITKESVIQGAQEPFQALARVIDAYVTNLTSD